MNKRRIVGYNKVEYSEHFPDRIKRYFIFNNYRQNNYD